MTNEERIASLTHANRNCCQMLSVIDRRLGEALACLDEGRDEDCRALLAQLKQAVPEAMRMIDTPD